MEFAGSVGKIILGIIFLAHDPLGPVSGHWRHNGWNIKVTYEDEEDHWRHMIGVILKCRMWMRRTTGINERRYKNYYHKT